MKNTPASHPADLFSQSTDVFNRDFIIKGNEKCQAFKKNNHTGCRGKTRAYWHEICLKIK
jgi:hypothetical protein